MGCASSNSMVPVENQVDNIWDHFDRVKMLGRGASGEVWLVKEKKNAKKMYALKKLDRHDPQNESMFQHECSILKMLQHPNILGYVSCYEVRWRWRLVCLLTRRWFLIRRHTQNSCF